MSAFYTSVLCYGSKIFYRGIDHTGKRVAYINKEYQPTLFLRSNKPSKFKTVKGENLEKINPGNIYETRQFVDRYKDVAGFEIFGNQRYEYVFISDAFLKKFIGTERR